MLLNQTKRPIKRRKCQINRSLLTDIALQGEYVASRFLDPIKIKIITPQRSESPQKQYPFFLPLRPPMRCQPSINRVQKRLRVKTFSILRVTLSHVYQWKIEMVMVWHTGRTACQRRPAQRPLWWWHRFPLSCICPPCSLTSVLLKLDDIFSGA